MKAHDIRSSFLSYFEDAGHRVVPSSSLVPADDPTLFFANAGMNQFKDVFTGQASRPYVRAATAQKCMRVSGKHNDFETVGRSLRHHTLFEMLGNFSFGDYFKSEAIAWAWQLLTERWNLPADELVVTVHESDDEAERIWRQEIGVAAARTWRLGDEENYWSMGDTGPNGPCSEIHHDRGAASGCGRPDCDPSCDCDRFSELWNLVFMQFDRDASGRVRDLPKPSIDTGMGLERIATLLQGRYSNYDTDLFAPIMGELERRSGVAQVPVEAGSEAASEADERQVSLRVVADHVRAVTFLVADGVVPTNEGRGYVLRKLLRRASGHGRRLGLGAPFLSELTATVVKTMGGAYPELEREAEVIRTTTEREERAFEACLEQGSGQLERVLADLRREGRDRIAGDEAFRLHDTFGFPLEYTVELAREAGLTVDREGFDEALEQQRRRARAAAKAGGEAPALPSDAVLPQTEFRGYEQTTTEECRVVGAFKDSAEVPALSAGEEGWVVLNCTPFYAESGGQVGDTGLLRAADGTVRATVRDTVSVRPGVHGHAVVVEEGPLEAGAEVVAEVDAARRRRIMANHTATHLLHRALKDVLGSQVRQAGSLVAPDRLRFDFNSHAAPTAEQLDEIERLVNEQVFAHRPVAKRTMSHADALASGAVAMFGEKYGDVVRVVAVDDWSVELCGGTHCDGTEQVGGFRIVSERGVAAGVRRIEAVTGPGLHERLRDDEALLDRVGDVLKAPRTELVASAERLAQHVRDLRRELEQARRELITGAAAPEGRRETVADGVEVEVRTLPDMDVNALREIADGARRQARVDALLIGSAKAGKAALVLALDPALAERLGDDAARELVVEIAREVQGGGGGRADFAWAGGRRGENLQAALDRLPTLLRERLSAAPRGAP